MAAPEALAASMQAPGFGRGQGLTFELQSRAFLADQFAKRPCFLRVLATFGCTFEMSKVFLFR